MPDQVWPDRFPSPRFVEGPRQPATADTDSNGYAVGNPNDTPVECPIIENFDFVTRRRCPPVGQRSTGSTLMDTLANLDPDRHYAS